MAKIIESNADMPKVLASDVKQAARAKALAEAHLGVKAKKAQGPRIQGFFSRTMRVTMADGHIVIIQFRVEPIDLTCFKQARKALGSVVPDIEHLKDPELEEMGVNTYFMTYMPGKTWLEAYLFDKWDPKLNIEAMASLGRILSRGHVPGDSKEVLRDEIKPKLEKLLSSEHEDVKKFRPDIQRLLKRSDQLETLPLWISHYDLNHVNILVQDDGQVSGIVDWESAKPLPFGVGLCRVHDLAGRYRNRQFHMPEDFEEAERVFWQSLLDGVPEAVRNILLSHLEEIETAVHIGSLLDTLDIKGETFNPAALDSLALLLTYRIPALREADEPPFPKV